MKRIIQIVFVLVIATNARGQESIHEADRCLDLQFHDKCFYASKSIFDDYIYLKSRPFSKKMSGTKFELNLKKDNLYVFNICEGENAKVVVNFYDAVDENTVIASTYNSTNRKYNQLLSFYTKSSGKYLISVSFADAKVDCCVILCGMIRKNIDHYIKIPD